MTLTPDQSGGTARAPLVPPRTATERAIAVIWADLLGASPIGVHDRFTELGGHSLLAIQVLWRLQEEYDVELPLRTIFDAVDLAALAAAVDATVAGAPSPAGADAAAPAAPPITALAREQQLPLSWTQQRLWFLDSLLPGNPFYNVPHVLLLDGPLDVEALQLALTGVVGRHEVLRARFDSDRGLPRQWVGAPWPVPLVRVDLSGEPAPTREERLGRLTAEEAAKPFDLSADRLLRATLVDLEPHRHALLLTLHHIVVDGWSMQILLRELAALYRGHTTGRPVPLPAPPLQYADFAAWQQSRDGDLDAQVAYWHRRLDGAPEALDVGADRPRPAVPSHQGRTARLTVPAELTAGLRALADRHSATLFMTLLAALQAVLGRRSGQSDLCVGSPVAGRPRPELESVVGPFFNSLVLRADLAGDPDFDELVRQARDTALEAYAHQDVPFERLVADLGPARELSRNPLFQVLFWVLPAQPGGGWDWGEVSVGRAAGASALPAAGAGAVHCDLEFFFAERGQTLEGTIKYSVDLFDPATIEQLTTDLVAVLVAVTADPRLQLSQLPVARTAGAAPPAAVVRPAAHPRPAYEAPRTATEQTLAGIWSELLDVPDVGPRDGFFALGGNSLLATQMLWLVQERCGVALPLQTAFSASTLDRLALAVDDENAPTAAVISPVPREGELPLSFAQQRLWFLDRLLPEGDTSYILQRVLRLRGRLDQAALDTAVGNLLLRQEVLRTRIVVSQGNPHQVVDPPPIVTLPIHDLRGTSAPEEAAADLIRQAAATGCRAMTGPVYDARLARLADDEHLLIWTMHHIAGDGWSLRRIGEELAALYRAAVTRTPSGLPVPPVQYADFAAWQRAGLAQRLAPDLAYWHAQLADVPQIDLPTDGERTADSGGAVHTFELDPELVAEVLEVGRSRGATPFMVLLAGFQALLHRYTGQQRFTVGCPASDRSRAETAQLVGLFLNVLVMRADCDGDPSFAELVDRARTTATEAYAHQDVPFELLVNELNPARDLSRNPLYQVDFQLHPRFSAESELDFPGLVVEDRPGAPVTTATVDLSLYLTEWNGRILGRIRYKTHLFTDVTISRFAGHFTRLLAAMAARPDQPISGFALPGPDELAELAAWNDTAEPGPDQCVHELFAAQAALAPERIAIDDDRSPVTYAELDRRAEALAGRLRTLGARPEKLLGLCLGRGAAAVVGMLGIWKAGGAYVPLDPDMPPERLNFVLADAGLDLVVTAPELAGRFPATVTLLAPDAGPAPTPDAPAIGPAAGPDNLAYAIYTSGSTGTPKGVLIQHAGLASFSRALSWAPPGRTGRIAQQAPLTFDQSLDTLLALCHGWTVVPVPEEVRRTPSGLVEWTDEHHIDVFESTPAQLHLLLRAGLLDRPGAPRTILVSGDVVDAHLWRSLAAAATTTSWNSYGPTECTVDVLIARVHDHNRPSIGRPIRNMRAYVLDDRLNPCPVGVPGHIYLGGIGLARGYLKRPGLTARQFVPDPFGTQPGGRLYRTGDSGRFRPDGSVEFLGRTDHQLKIRGYRIEPGEVESALLRLPAVAEAAVIARGDADRRRLVAYLTAAGGLPLPDVGQLRAHLGRFLPDYMLPSAFVWLPALPLTANGKLDRGALPEPSSRPETSADYEAPSSATEKALAAVWADLLGLDRVGRQDNFFELGGNSLLAVRMLWELEEHHALTIPVELLFETTTLAQLSEALGRAQTAPTVFSRV